MALNRHLWLGVLAVGLLGCRFPFGSTTPGPSPRAVSGPPKGVAPKAQTMAALGGRAAISLPPGQMVGPESGTLVALKAGVRVSGDGKRLINLDGGALINLDGGALINLDGGTLANPGVGALMGTVHAPAGMFGGAYRLTDATPTPAAGVQVYFRDAAGRFVVDAGGRLVSTTTDAQGRFLLQGYLALRGLSCFVPIESAGAEVRGLSAVRPRDLRSGVSVAVDPVSTVLASWVEAGVMAAMGAPSKEAALNRLTGAVAQQARDHLARVFGAGWSGTSTGWSAEAVAAEADRRKAEDGALEGALREVRRVLLAGADPCTDGVRALETSLRMPLALAAPAGSDALVVAGYLSGLVQRVEGLGAEPRLFAVAGNCPALKDAPAGSVPAPSRMVGGPDGWIYSVSTSSAAVHRFKADGSAVEKLAGQGARLPAVGVVASELRLEYPGAVGVMRDGSWWVGENGVDRLTHVGPEGVVLRVYEGVIPQGSNGLGIAASPDGAVWVLTERSGSGSLWRLGAGESAFRQVAMLAEGVDYLTSSLAALPDGRAVVSCGGRTGPHHLKVITADGRVEVLAGGDGAVGYNHPGEVVSATQARFASPAGLAVRGGPSPGSWTLYVADFDNGLIRAVDPSGRVSIAAGSRAAQDELARTVALSQPVSVALDPRQRPVLTESGGGTIRRLEGDLLRRIAGGEPQPRGSDGRLAAEHLDMPVGISAVGADFFVVEASSLRISRLSADVGLIEVVAGGGSERQPLRRNDPIKARDVFFRSVFGVATDPEGRAIFAGQVEDLRGERSLHHILWRLEKDGTLTRLAGAISGPTDLSRDGRLGTEVQLGFVMGLACDAAGTIYLTEVTEGLVWRLDPQGRLHHVAGISLADRFGRWAQGSVADPPDTPARQALLTAPAGLTVGPDGSLFLAEYGTRGLAAYIHEFGLDLGFEVSSLPMFGGRIRKLTPDGRAVTLAGEGVDDSVRNPSDVELGPDGTLLVVDNGAGQLKELRLDGR